MPIKKLPDQLINQIAAGEVVENPASVIKELVENSLDAGASRIEVHIKAGGYQLIEVIDNGHGIEEGEALLAFERHTTSKLQTLEDLEQHQKMGFRGEALASIASCSKVILKTATQEGEGLCIELLGGVLQNQAYLSLKKGTSIAISDLFFNTPARKKFQKSTTASLVEIEKELFALMLAHPQVSFIFKADKQTRLEVYSDKQLSFETALRKRIYALLADIPVEKGKFLYLEDPLLTIHGYLAPLDYHHAHRKNQFFIVNHRPVEAFSLKMALNEALRTFLPEKRFCSGVFHLQINPKWIDINIHPQKKEVRFAEEGYVKSQIGRLVTPKLSHIETSFKAPTSFSAYTLNEIPKQTAPKQEVAFNPPFWIKTIGYFTPYLLIDSREIPALSGQKGLVLFDAKTALKHRALEDFIEKTVARPSQGLLIPYPLLSFAPNHAISFHKPLWKQLGFEINTSDELIAHPPEIECEEAKRILSELIQKALEGAKEPELIAHFFNKLFEHIRPNFEDVLRSLGSLFQKPWADIAPYFSCISDEHLKELFYEYRQS